MNISEFNREEINKRYVESMEHLINKYSFNKQSEVSSRIGEAPTTYSQIKGGNKNASLAQLVKAINEFDLNANYLFRVQNNHEPIEYSELNINPTISGSNKDVMIGKNVSKNDGTVHGDVYNVETMIQQAPQELKEYINDLNEKHLKLETRSNALDLEIQDLKKIIREQSDQINEMLAQIREKDDRLYQSQCELIEVYKKQKD